jgi:hypothetical protein
MRLPQRPEEITAGWIDEVLHAGGALIDQRVVGVSAVAIGGERGFLSQTIRVHLEYDRSTGSEPASVVVKIEPGSRVFAEAVQGIKAFEREIGFYADVAPRLPIRLPRVWCADVLAEGNVLVMEDLSALDGLDQVHGVRHEHVLAAVRAIAIVHARYWNEPSLAGLTWLPDHDHFIGEGYVEHWPAFARAYELNIGRDAVALGERVARHKEWLEERIMGRAATLIHSDLRGDNLLHDPATGEVIVIDWQLSTRSLGAIDPARLLGGSEPPPERRGHQLETFATWHDALGRAGVRDYDAEEALEDFRLAVLYCLFIPVKVFALVGPDAGGRAGRLCDAQAQRFFASALELDAGRLLP